MDTAEASSPEPQNARPGWAFVVGWSVDSPGGVNGVLNSLLDEFHRAGRFSPLVVLVTGVAKGLGPAKEKPWPVIRFGTAANWSGQRPWYSIAVFCVRFPFVLWRLKSLCRQFSIKVFNIHFVGIDDIPFLLLRRIGLFDGKLVLSFHGLDIKKMAASQGLERYLSKFLLRGADSLVACSAGLRDEIVRFVPECESRTVSIPNGIDAAAFVALAAEDFPLPERFTGRTILLNVGSYEHKKGHDLLLRAFASLLRGRANIALVIAGQGKSDSIARLAVELRVQDHVLLLEDVPRAQIAALMKRADIFILSSRWEPFGLVLLEAGAAGKPVVSTATAGAAEVLCDGVTGRVVPIDDADALATAISGLIDDPDGALHMARRLSAHVLNNFTWSQAYRAYADIAP